ncbi:MAG: hypothetical protein HZA62_06045 [Rhodocyclales bacterium]|nr:hypothetical protein [Rhodocyclales bacterium]
MMIRAQTVALVLALSGASAHSLAQFDDDIFRSITIHCSYSDHKTFQSEAVSIEGTKSGAGEPASIRTFQRGATSQDTTYIVKPGEVAECVFPSGNRVRAKVGEGTARPYGMCGGDPEVFASVWVNERKVASRIWFTGHCREEKGNPDVSFKFSGYRKVSVQKCHSERPTDSDVNDKAPNSRSKQPLSVCVDYPEISRFPRDQLEYLRPNQKVPVVGETELLTGSHEVCKAVIDEVFKSDFFTSSNDPIPETSELRRPNWDRPSVELPRELAGSSESVFDFDNDGKLDRVIRQEFESNYMDGSVLLVLSGNSSLKLSVPDSPIDKSSWFIPCQLSRSQYEIHDCPPFSQKGDDAGFSMKMNKGKDSIFFRARYSSVAPFSFRRESFIGVSSKSEDSINFVAVLKPMPNRTFQPICLFRQVTENF